ncbi:MAG: PHP domain-containing protein [Tepidanaerobacteraceae bacterium]|jgi:predicted metal-dependent phosphoesterase TrpH|nr:PHP domain-containing protein [Tepidanaerobacteraceae bacterium]
MIDSPLFENKNTDNIKVDLHVHTTASDGTWPPEKLVENMLGAGIEIFAVTDHDTTENLAQVASAARERGLKFIAGVEINATCSGRNYHILGLGIDPGNKELQMLLKKNRELTEAKDDESIKFLEGKFPQVSFDEYKEYVNNPARGGWKALNYLIDKKLCTSYKDFFSLFEGWGNPFEKLIFAPPDEVIKTIHMAGGVSILAHPGAGFYNGGYKDLIAFMIGEGIRGIECYHPENSPEITRYCLEICQSKNLLVTGGSDCHGEFVVGRHLGHPDVRLSQLKLDGIHI